MKKATSLIRLERFDAARYLADEVAIAEYMAAVFEIDDPKLMRLALADVAKAKATSAIVRDTGLGA